MATQFVVNDTEEKATLQFLESHKCKLKREKMARSLTYLFTRTHIGTAVKVHCSCGKKQDVTDYNSW